MSKCELHQVQFPIPAQISSTRDLWTIYKRVGQMNQSFLRRRRPNNRDMPDATVLRWTYFDS